MGTSAASPPDTTKGMAKGDKKTDREKRTTPRVNVGVPEPWHAIARRLAAKNRQPVIYLLIALLKAEAERQGIANLPVPPWDEGEE